MQLQIDKNLILPADKKRQASSRSHAACCLKMLSENFPWQQVDFIRKQILSSWLRT